MVPGGLVPPRRSAAAVPAGVRCLGAGRAACLGSVATLPVTQAKDARVPARSIDEGGPVDALVVALPGLAADDGGEQRADEHRDEHDPTARAQLTLPDGDRRQVELGEDV